MEWKQILKGDTGGVALGDSSCGTLEGWKGAILIGSCSELRCEAALPWGVRNPWWLGQVSPDGGTTENALRGPTRLGGSRNWAVTLGRQFPLF